MKKMILQGGGLLAKYESRFFRKATIRYAIAIAPSPIVPRPIITNSRVVATTPSCGINIMSGWKWLNGYTYFC